MFHFAFELIIPRQLRWRQWPVGTECRKQRYSGTLTLEDERLCVRLCVVCATDRHTPAYTGALCKLRVARTSSKIATGTKRTAKGGA